jgi:hypothetical protein
MVVKTLLADTCPHKYTTFARSSPRAQSKPTTYGLDFTDYEDIISFFERVKSDPDLASQLIALLESEWRPAVATALDEFYERIQCSNCNFIPGAYGWNRKLLPDGQRRLDALIMEMKRFPVEGLTLGKVVQYKAKLGKLEKEYLDVNLGKMCKGFA